MKKKVLAALLVLLYSSCHSIKREINDFDVVKEVRVYDSLYSDKDSISGMIMDMEVNNGVIVTSHRNDEFNYSFIDSKTGKLLARWGKRGEGINEFLDYGNGFVLKDSMLVFMERMRKEIVYVPIPDILSGKSLSELKVGSESYPCYGDFRPMQFCLVNHTKVFTGAFERGRLGMLDFKGDTLSNDTDYPFATEPVNGLFRGNVFQSKVKSTGKNDRFVVQTMFSDVFEIYQYTGTILKRVAVSPYNHPPRIMQKHNRYGIDYEGSVAGLLMMSVSDDCIYFLYSSLSSNESDKVDGASNEVLCFDWNGKKICKYILPLPVTAFCVDDSYIYGVYNDNDESIICRFKL